MTGDNNTDEEYQNLCSEKSAKESEASSVESTISSLDGQIEAMQAAYDSIDDAKESIKDIRKYIRNLPDDYDDSWKGSFADTIYTDCRKDGTRVDYYYTRYIDLIDDIQDDLNWKLTELENERLRQETILGDLWAAINSLATRIQNWFN